MKEMQEIKAIRELLATPKKILITTHHKPDADALGSSLGLAGYLKKKGHQVHGCYPFRLPGFPELDAGPRRRLLLRPAQQ